MRLRRPRPARTLALTVRTVHKIELEVWVDNEATIARYERGGFESEGVCRNHYRRRDGRLRSSVIMVRLFPDAIPTVVSSQKSSDSD